jgi:hypothetical protein
MILERFVAETLVASDPTEFSGGHFFYAIRLIGALVLATLVPLLIDRRFRR